MKRTFIVSILSFALLAGVAAPAIAKDQAVPNTSFMIYIPDDFKLDGNADLLTAENAEKTCSFLWAIAPAKDLEKAAAGVTALIGNLVSDIKEGKPAKKTVNGLPTLVMTATGVEKATKKPVVIITSLTQLDDKVLITVGAVHKDQKAKYKAVAEKVFAGVRKK